MNINFNKKDVIFIFVIILLLILLIFNISLLTKRKNELTISQHNIEALNDTIKYHKTKNNDLVAEKMALIGDISVLKHSNEKLLKDISAMGLSKPSTVVYVETVVENEKHDTIYNDIECDEGFNKPFNFSDEFRKLSGNIICDQNLTLQIDTDIVNVDYTLALENNKIYIKSDNPYVKYNNIVGLDVPEYEPTWCFVIGPSVSLGWDPFRQFIPNNGYPIDFSFGVSATFGWNIKGVGKRVRKR